jgi:hypothetical protein
MPTTMSKLTDQIALITKDRPSETVPAAQVAALIAGKGRVEHLQALANEYSLDLRLERRPKRDRDEK